MSRAAPLAVSALALAGLLLSGCGELRVGPLDIVQGSGTVRQESRDVRGFDRVVLGGAGSLTVTQGDTESLTIEAEDNLLPRLRSAVSGGTLRVGPDRVAIQPTKPIRYDLHVIRLSSLEVSGAAQADAASIHADALALRVTGAGQVRVGQLSASSLSVNITGTGQVSAAGQAPRQTIAITGAGRYRAPDLATQDTTVSVSGTGDCSVRASDHLAVTISGAGAVTYAGSPTVDQHVTGTGHLTPAG